MSNIMIVRLKTGEELVADADISFGEAFLSEGHAKSSSRWKLVKPALLHQGMDPTGKLGFALIPFGHLMEKHEIEISGDDILYSGTPVIEVINQYNRLFGSGIQIAAGLPR